MKTMHILAASILAAALLSGCSRDEPTPTPITAPESAPNPGGTNDSTINSPRNNLNDGVNSGGMNNDGTNGTMNRGNINDDGTMNDGTMNDGTMNEDGTDGTINDGGMNDGNINNRVDPNVPAGDTTE